MYYPLCSFMSNNFQESYVLIKICFNLYCKKVEFRTHSKKRGKTNTFYK